MNDSMKPNSCKLHAIQKSRGNLYLIRWHVTKKISSYILQRSSCKAFQNSLQKMNFSAIFSHGKCVLCFNHFCWCKIWQNLVKISIIFLNFQDLEKKNQLKKITPTKFLYIFK